jgi:hypothetical protein
MLRDGLISLGITAVLLTVINFLLVAFALRVFTQPYFPRALLKYIDPCYQTIYHSTHGESFENWIAVVGDSYAAGSGDEFLDRKPDYGIFPKLRSLTNGNYFVFARAGFGSINAAKELKLCMSMFEDSLLLPRVGKPKELLFVFYEGNDLNNNVNHLRLARNGESVAQFVQDQVSHPDGERWRRMEAHFPLFDLLAGELSRLGGPLRDKKRRRTPEASETARDDGRTGAPRAEQGPGAAANPGAMRVNHAIIGQQARPVPRDPQSAAAELSGRLDVPLQVFYESVLALSRYLPGTKITILYLPSVVTTYAWQDPVRVEAYHTSDPVFTTTGDNEDQSRLIRKSIADFADRHRFGFIDPTARLQSAARAEFIHGPRDWEHFNAAGNWIIAETVAGSAAAATAPVQAPAKTGGP